MNLFYATTTIIIGNGKIAPFWDSPWLYGEKPKDTAPLIMKLSRKRDAPWHKPCITRDGWQILRWMLA
jgi:hypothetical protein